MFLRVVLIFSMNRKDEQRERDDSNGIVRYEVRCFYQDKPLVRFFANWTMEHNLTIEELKDLLDGEHEVKED
jgi:hypothetical protein